MQHAGNRKVELVAEEVALSDSDFLGRWAAKLTFNPLNSHNFIFTTSKRGSASSREQPENSYLESDLFKLSDTFRSSVIVCPCSAQYPFLTVKCPICGGTDPVGGLWQRHGNVIIQLLSDLTLQGRASASPFRESFESAFKSFEAALTAERNTALMPIETDDEGASSRKLLSYYEEVFRQGCLNEEIITGLSVAPRHEYMRIINGLRNTARNIRSIWKTDCTAGWNPTEAFAKKCLGDLIEGARPGVQGVGYSAQQMIKVAAQFGPLHSEFIRRAAASEDGVGMFFRGAWRAFKAVKTMGVSELIRAGCKGMKDKKFRERFERFSKDFNAAVASCAKTGRVIDHSLARHDDLLLRLAKSMRYHMIIVLAEDYAAAGSDDQIRIADSLAKAVQCPPLTRGTFNDRGLDAQKRRRAIFLWYVVVGITFLLAIVTLLVVLFR